jgi:hypothetical protein
MTENKTLRKKDSAYWPINRFLCLALLCCVFVLSGCDNYRPAGFGKKATKSPTLKGENLYQDEKRRGTGGFNPKNMFGKSLKSDDQRLDRLERAVQEMRNEFDTTKPSITRLTALEGEIQALIDELQTLNREGSLPAIQPMPMPAPAPSPVIVQQQAPMPTPTPAPITIIDSMPAPIAPAPAVTIATPKASYQRKSVPPMSNGQASVYDLRIGEHPGRTRLVMDANGKTGFSVDVDNSENIAVIELPQAGWTASTSKALAKSNFISSYSVQPSGNGHILILQLKRNAQVTYKDDLAGPSGNSRRLVVDLSGS